MTGSVLNLALQLVVLHVKLESVKHGVLLDALVEVSVTQTLFQDRAQKVGLLTCELQHALVAHYILRYQPILDNNSPTGIGLKYFCM